MSAIHAEKNIRHAVGSAIEGADPYNPLSFTDVAVSAAEGAMQHAGYPVGIDPALVVVAGLSKKAVEKIAMSDMERDHAASLLDIYKTGAHRLIAIDEQHRREMEAITGRPVDAPMPRRSSVLDQRDLPKVRTSRALDTTRERLYPRFGRRAAVKAAAGGLALGAWFYGGVAETKADFGIHNYTMTVAGRELALKPDKSILPGSSGKNVPVVDLLTHIPGIPDYSDVVIPTYEERSVTEDVEIHQIAEAGGTAINPVAKDLQLTGREYKLDVVAARKFIKDLKATGVQLDSIEITGITSDLFRSEVGHDDTANNGPQSQLAAARAKVMLKALQNEAKKSNVKLPKLSTAVREDILTDAELLRVDAIAGQRKITSEQLWQQFSEGTLPKDIYDELNGMSQPGAELLGIGTKKTIQKVITGFTTVEGTETFEDISGEAVLLPATVAGGIIGGGYGTMFGLLRANAYARRRARKEVSAQIAGAKRITKAYEPYAPDSQIDVDQASARLAAVVLMGSGNEHVAEGWKDIISRFNPGMSAEEMQARMNRAQTALAGSKGSSPESIAALRLTMLADLVTDAVDSSRLSLGSIGVAIDTVRYIVRSQHAASGGTELMSNLEGLLRRNLIAKMGRDVPASERLRAEYAWNLMTAVPKRAKIAKHLQSHLKSKQK